MKIGQHDLDVITVGDVKLYVHLPWGNWKQYTLRLREIDKQPDVEQGPLLQELAETALLESVRRVEGLEDADGNPVTKLTPDVILQLPRRWVMEAFAAVMQMGEGPAPTPAS